MLAKLNDKQFTKWSDGFVHHYFSSTDRHRGVARVTYIYLNPRLLRGVLRGRLSFLTNAREESGQSLKGVIGMKWKKHNYHELRNDRRNDRRNNTERIIC